MHTARLLTYLGGGSACRGDWADPPPWTEWQTDRCKNITFPQLRLRAVKLSVYHIAFAIAFKIALAISGRAMAARVHDGHQLFVPRLGGSAHTGRYYRSVAPCKGTWIHYFCQTSYNYNKYTIKIPPLRHTELVWTVQTQGAVVNRDICSDTRSWCDQTSVPTRGADVNRHPLLHKELVWTDICSYTRSWCEQRFRKLKLIGARNNISLDN